jgi:SRSO17 transposase
VSDRSNPLSIAHHHVSLPIAYRLYLPEDWAKDAKRRKKAHIPEEVSSGPSREIALDQIEAVVKDGVARGVVLTDVAYGCDGTLRADVTALGLTSMRWGCNRRCRSGLPALPPRPWSGRGRKPSRLRHDAEHRPVSAKELAMRLSAEAWKDVEWREGLKPDFVFALRRRARPAGVARPQTGCAASRRMARRRMAGGRGGADQILALDLARE